MIEPHGTDEGHDMNQDRETPICRGRRTRHTHTSMMFLSLGLLLGSCDSASEPPVATSQPIGGNEQVAVTGAESVSSAASGEPEEEAVRRAVEEPLQSPETVAAQSLDDVLEQAARTIRAMDHAAKKFDRGMSQSKPFEPIIGGGWEPYPIPVGYVGKFNTDDADTEALIRRYDQFMFADDDRGMAEMEDSGVIRWFSGSARVIQTISVASPGNWSHLRYCELRIMDGPREGDLVWASLLSVQ